MCGGIFNREWTSSLQTTVPPRFENGTIDEVVSQIMFFESKS
jgi:hypothetical protein